MIAFSNNHSDNNPKDITLKVYKLDLYKQLQRELEKLAYECNKALSEIKLLYSLMEHYKVEFDLEVLEIATKEIDLMISKAFS